MAATCRLLDPVEGALFTSAPLPASLATLFAFDNNIR
jgi:hypothetical protein